MKTKWNALRRSSLLPTIMAAVFALTTMSCEKEVPLLQGEYPDGETTYSGNIMTETFWVGPEATNVDLFKGDVSLEFPEGTVAVPTEFNMTTFSLHHLSDMEGHNIYNRGYSLVGATTYQKLQQSIKIRLRYDLLDSNWLKGAPTDPGSITILNVSPTLYSYERVVSIGDCCTDFNCKIVKGCICQCGFYVVGEN